MAKKDELVEFIIFREVPVTLDRVFIYSIGILFAENIQYIFPLAAFSSIFFLLF